MESYSSLLCRKLSKSLPPTKKGQVLKAGEDKVTCYVGREPEPTRRAPMTRRQLTSLMSRRITGRHVSLDITSVCFSAFSVVSLFGFFFLEKRKAKRSQEK
ncbi:High-affinity nitrate transporter [Melia azedarach]|uniref:High-affinity nitrate transporter n=1 Tax=Melia azedarach TaxID=155640 RepID=A0ACC1XLU2_MELAZ|nr:High-affinity nitrate transporter [Melia azedarach]